jgi:hypothetical protein
MMQEAADATYARNVMTTATIHQAIRISILRQRLVVRLLRVGIPLRPRSGGRGFYLRAGACAIRRIHNR